MRAVAAESAFEQDEAIYVERVRPEIRVPPQEDVDGIRVAAVPASERDVRHECAMLGFESGLLDCALDLRREDSDAFLRPHAGPQRASVPLLEFSNADDA